MFILFESKSIFNLENPYDDNQLFIQVTKGIINGDGLKADNLLLYILCSVLDFKLPLIELRTDADLQITKS